MQAPNPLESVPVGPLLDKTLERISQRRPLILSGLGGSAKAWMVAALAAALQGREPGESDTAPLLVVAESFEGAEKLRKDIAFFSDGQPVRFFPHWDTLPYDSFSPQVEVTALRFETLAALLDGRCPVLVTTPQALMQGMMPPQRFLALRFELAVGQTHRRSDLVNRLVSAGYARVDLVEAAGEFSIRGEICDIFSIQLDHPARLDFFDDEIESIRSFSVEDQKSFEPLESVTVYPASETPINAETAREGLERIPRYKSRAQPENYQQIYAMLERAGPFPGCEHMMGLFYEPVAWLYQILPQGTIVLLDEPERLEARARDATGEVLQEYELALEQGTLALPPEMLYLTPEKLQSALDACYTVPMGEMRLEGEPAALVFPFAGNQTLRSLNAASPSSDDRSGSPHNALASVLAQVRTWRDAGAEVYLGARSRTGAERLRHVLAEFDLGAALRAPEAGAFLPGHPPLAGPTVRGAGGDVTILTDCPSQGFRIVDDGGETRFALITEEEVVGEKTRPRRLSKSKLRHFISSLGELKEGDAVVHVEYGIGRYQGLQRLTVGGVEGDFLLIQYAGGDKVYVPVYKFNQIQNYTGLEGTRPVLNRLGDGAWQRSKQKAAKHIQDMAEELVRVYAARKARPGHAFQVDEAMMAEFEETFPYQETEDQERAIGEVLADMRGEMPMDRLVCGDVGFGKTEVAMRAAFLCVLGGKQVLVLVPTTILAQQHNETFGERFGNFAARVDVISRFRSPAEQKAVLKEFAEGKIDVLIGTHRLLSRDVRAKDLGLLVIDEEQRFGVTHKEKIKQMRTQLDVVTLSATPIPRTLHMALMGVRDLSIINTPPMDRIAVRTRLAKASDYVIREGVMREIRRGGQVFIVHNRVETIHAYGNYLQSILPGVHIVLAHGQMGERQLEETMLRFVQAEADVLLSTSIIESGLDIPRANTIIITNSDKFGLAQLYQMRGRVGRSNVQAYAYLLVSPDKVLTGVAQKRLTLLQELNDLGSGFRIASHDMEIRGAGNLLGREQSGNINTVGLELYTAMVEEAVAQLKGEEPAALERPDFKLDLGFSYLLPEAYIESTQQRLDLYKRLAEVKSGDELWDIRENLEDRYGAVPEEVGNLFTLIRIRLLALDFGLSSLEQQNGELVAKFGDSHRVDVERLMALVDDPASNTRLLPGDRLSLGRLPENPESVLQQLKDLEPVMGTRAA